MLTRHTAPRSVREISGRSGPAVAIWAGLSALIALAGSMGCGSSGADSGGAAGGPLGADGGAPMASGGAPSGGAGMGMAGTGTAGTGSAGTPPSSGGSSAGGAAGSLAAGGGGASAGGAGGSAAGAGGKSGSSGGGAGGSAGSSGGASSVTCPTSTLAAGDSTQTVMVGATSRTYVLHVPAKYQGTQPTPLVIDFHPLGGSGPSERSASPYPAQTDPDGVVMAFPSGMAGPSGGAWNVGPCCVKDVDDVAFAKALVAQVEQKACIDPKRVYAVGYSMGGGMSHYLACHAADVFAAVSPAAFDLLQENVTDCKPPRPITVISFRSTSDPVVAYAGGYSALVQGMPITFLGAKGTFEKWAALNQCSGSASAADSAGCQKYSGCAGGVDVILCTKQGGGHDQGNASVSWPILKQHTLP